MTRTAWNSQSCAGFACVCIACSWETIYALLPGLLYTAVQPFACVRMAARLCVSSATVSYYAALQNPSVCTLSALHSALPLLCPAVQLCKVPQQLLQLSVRHLLLPLPLRLLRHRRFHHTHTPLVPQRLHLCLLQAELACCS